MERRRCIASRHSFTEGPLKAFTRRCARSGHDGVRSRVVALRLLTRIVGVVCARRLMFYVGSVWLYASRPGFSHHPVFFIPGVKVSVQFEIRLGLLVFPHKKKATR